MSITSTHHSMRGLLLFGTLMAGATLLTTAPAQAVTFNFSQGTELQNSSFRTSVVNGFTQAASFFSSRFNDDVTINISINYRELGTGILGQASSTAFVGVGYDFVRDALIADATSADDATSIASLPADSRSFLTNSVSGTIVLDDDGSPNNTSLDVNTATAKAMGLVDGNFAVQDASITFNSQFPFDFDRGDGIGSTEYDFIGVAIHEIGHALGFTSGVDEVDSKFGQDLNATSVLRVLDLFRYTADSFEVGAGVLDMAVGGTPYFSIDGGQNSLGTFSTGSTVHGGDGQQASHWADGLGLGIMDPTLSNGELAMVRPLDLRAFDVIGWDLSVTAVPEPSSIVLVAVGIACIVGQRLRSRRKSLT